AQNGMHPPRELYSYVAPFASRYGDGGPRTRSGTAAPNTAPTISAQLPAPRNETPRPTSDPIPAPTTATMIRLPISICALIPKILRRPPFDTLISLLLA